MTAMETWATQLAAEIVKDDVDAQRPVTTTIEQRLCVALLEARHKELKYLAGEIALKHGHHAILQQYGRQVLLRAQKLEKLALDWATTWPPPDQDKCTRCQSDNIKYLFGTQADGGTWGCDDCGATFKGSLVEPPRIIQ